MNFVIPMAGNGSRFVAAGYPLPKMLIEAKGKTLMEWSIDSLPLGMCTNLVCIILRKHEEEHNLSALIRSLYAGRVGDIKVVVLDEVTRGQAETVYLAQEAIDDRKGLLIYNIDTAFGSRSLAASLQDTAADGILGAFASHEDRFSFARTNEEGIVTETAEKQVISGHALTGLYHFRSPGMFYQAFEHHLEHNLTYKQEFYIAPMYNYLIGKGYRFKIDEVDSIDILGTPEELDAFLAINPL